MVENFYAEPKLLSLTTRIAFGATCFFAGLSGGLHALQLNYVTVESVFGIRVPLFVIMMSILVSDSGIDALGIRIENFVPGHWRFADETIIRESEQPQYW